MEILCFGAVGGGMVTEGRIPPKREIAFVIVMAWSIGTEKRRSPAEMSVRKAIGSENSPFCPVTF